MKSAQAVIERDEDRACRKGSVEGDGRDEVSDRERHIAVCQERIELVSKQCGVSAHRFVPWTRIEGEVAQDGNRSDDRRP